MQRVHFIGIGGYSMSGLALALKARGFDVTGSDARSSERTARLVRAGIAVSYGHRAENVGIADTVVFTTDVPETNPERRAAQDHGLSILHRSELLAWLMREHRTVLVTGTHGKTTTTSMIGLILKAAGMDPLILVGGDVSELGNSNVYLGGGPWVVAEADESDGSFLRYQPTVAVVTNVESEHLEHYGGSFDNLVQAMRAFVAKVPNDGLCVLGVDETRRVSIAEACAGSVETYGDVATADWKAQEIRLDPAGTRFLVTYSGRVLGPMTLKVPGRHNVLNALAATAAANFLGVPFATIARALASFGGAKRRFQTLSWVHGIRVVDDYAHHPTEIRATLAAARQVTRGRVLAGFQPQRYSRTEQLWPAFLEVLGGADAMLVTDIYAPAGETPNPSVEAPRLVEEARARHPDAQILYASTLEAMCRWFEDHARPGDTVLTMGAGDIWRVSHALATRLSGKRTPV